MATEETEDKSPPSAADLWGLAKQLAGKLKDWAPVSTVLLLILAGPISAYTKRIELVFFVALAMAAMLLILRGWQMYLEVGLTSKKLDNDLAIRLAKENANFQLKALKKQATAVKGQTPRVRKAPTSTPMRPSASKE